MSIRVHQIAFEEDAVVIGYTDFPNDVRVNGQVMVMHQAQISMGHVDYREDAELLMAQAKRMLKNALDDFEESEPYDPEVRDDEDERGMGE